MELTNIVSYRRWRNKLTKKGFFAVGAQDDYSFQGALEQARKSHNQSRLDMRLNMFIFRKSPNEKDRGRDLSRLVDQLFKLCKKERLFRKDKVEKLKRMIANHEYHVPGQAVVDKWFPPESES